MNRIILFLSLCLISTPAFADYFVWQDPKSRLSVTFPDTWKKQSNSNSATILTMAAPSNNEGASCKIQTYDDNRYTIFPPSLGRDVQKEAVSIPFWKSYMGHYNDYDIGRVYDGGGLGRWVASYATVSYSANEGTAQSSRRGIMFASLYHDTLYVVECSSYANSYEKWERNFRSVIKSIDFKKIYHERITGHYANFLKDVDQYFWAQTGSAGTIGYN